MYKSLQTVRPWVLAVACLAPAELDGAGRELTTDRPDATESPYTVAARRVQVEADAASFARDTAAGQRTETWEAGAFNVRLGLTARTELGLFVVPFRQVRESGLAGPAVTRRG